MRIFCGVIFCRNWGNAGCRKSHKTEIRILESKSASSVRIIPQPDIIMECLKRFHVPEAYVLTGDGIRYVEPRTMQNRFKKIFADCGIRDANFHATRHTFATRCIELGGMPGGCSVRMWKPKRMPLPSIKRISVK